MPPIEHTYFDLTLFCRAIGLAGVILYVLGFFLLCTGRIDSTLPTFFILNFMAAGFVLISLTVDFNLSAALIQAFYLTMSLGGIVKRARLWRTNGLRIN